MRFYSFFEIFEIYECNMFLLYCTDMTLILFCWLKKVPLQPTPACASFGKTLRNNLLASDSIRKSLEGPRAQRPPAFLAEKDLCNSFCYPKEVKKTSNRVYPLAPTYGPSRFSNPSDMEIHLKKEPFCQTLKRARSLPAVED